MSEQLNLLKCQNIEGPLLFVIFKNNLRKQQYNTTLSNPLLPLHYQF